MNISTTAMLILLLISASTSRAEESKITRIEGATVVCSGEGAKLVFNENLSRAWIVPDQAEPLLQGFELRNVSQTMKESNDIVAFKGTLEMRWGSETQINEYDVTVSGAIGTATATAIQGKAGRRTMALSCAKP